MSKYVIIYLQKNTMCREEQYEKHNINFIFGLLDRKKVSLCLFIEAFLDFMYYVIPYFNVHSIYVFFRNVERSYLQLFSRLTIDVGIHQV